MYDTTLKEINGKHCYLIFLSKNIYSKTAHSRLIFFLFQTQMVYFKQQTRNDIYCSKELVNIDIFQIANIHVFRNPVLGDKYITKKKQFD